MRILLIGARGDIGQAVLAELQERHDVIQAGRSSGDVRVDITDPEAVRQMYASVEPLDAVVSVAGDVQFARLGDYTEETFAFGLNQKAMGQINLVLLGQDHVAPNGSFTLTSGILDRVPILKGASSAAANGALDGFVRAAALDMPHKQRVNVVSPGLLEVSAAAYGSLFPGHIPVSSERVGRAYAQAVEGAQTGQVFIVD
jgi:uncharacterized protein YbjT (DUF2867 family)